MAAIPDSHKPLEELVDRYVEKLRVDLKARLILGEQRYQGTWVDLTPVQVVAMLYEEDLDSIVYRLMLLHKLSQLQIHIKNVKITPLS